MKIDVQTHHVFLTMSENAFLQDIRARARERLTLTVDQIRHEQSYFLSIIKECIIVPLCIYLRMYGLCMYINNILLLFPWIDVYLTTWYIRKISKGTEKDCKTILLQYNVQFLTDRVLTSILIESLFCFSAYFLMKTVTNSYPWYVQIIFSRLNQFFLKRVKNSGILGLGHQNFQVAKFQGRGQ